MTAVYDRHGIQLHHGDCLDVLRGMPDNSVQAVVTDPPYNLSFMGKGWDSHDTPFGFQQWCTAWAVQCLRVLTPGGHLLAFGGTRTSHRLASGIEDAGFEIRDSITWLYGSGFSKSWNFGTRYQGEWCTCSGNTLPLSHASDPSLHGLRDHLPASPVSRGAGEGTNLLPEVQRSESRPGLGQACPQGTSSVVPGSRGVVPSADAGGDEPCLAGRELHRTRQGVPDDSASGSPAGPSERVRRGAPAGDGGDDRASGDAARGSAPPERGPGRQPTGEPEAVPGSHVALDDRALRDGPVCPRCGGLDPAFRGFGTGLKPASEPIVVARKPLSGTVAATVLEHGTGALNIDACRTAGGPTAGGGGWAAHKVGQTEGWDRPYVNGVERTAPNTAGRWPANVVLTHAPACAETCVDSGEIKLRVYVDGRGEIAPASSLAHLLDRQRSLLADLNMPNRSDNTLWPHVADFYHSGDSRPFEEIEPASLIHEVQRVLGRTELPDSPVGCQSCRDFDGARVREVLEAARGGLTSLLDVLAAATRQAFGHVRTPWDRDFDRPSSSDDPRPAVQSSCTHPNNTSDASHVQLSEVGIPSSMSGTGSTVLRHDATGDSTQANSTPGSFGSPGNFDHSPCRYAAIRLLTLLTFDIASRFVTPPAGVYAKEVVLSLPRCPVAELDAQSGNARSSGVYSGDGSRRPGDVLATNFGGGHRPATMYDDSGGASRFFPTFHYEPKAPAAERPKIDGVAHPTVKPIDLMRWLIRLVTPPGGTVLDPFAGTGTTGHAARAENVRAILIERDDTHIPLIVSRLEGYRQNVNIPGQRSATEVAEQMDLLGLIDGNAS
jgi:DNA modification methylase